MGKYRITKGGETQKIGMPVYWLERKRFLIGWERVEMFNAEDDAEAIKRGRELLVPPPDDIVVDEWERMDE